MCAYTCLYIYVYIGIKVISYTDDEWERYIRDLDATWSREENDHLIHLCHRFDLRFVVISDRYDVQYIRSIEELKDRYYSVAKKLLQVSDVSLTA